MCVSPEQQKQKDDARREAIEYTQNVNATGQKSAEKEYDDASNQINNE